MNREELISKIKEKREFSMIPEEDLLLAYSKFQKRECSEEEKIRLTKDLLRRVYSAFASGKLMNFHNKEEAWFLRKHLSTRERLDFYPELYPLLFKTLGKSGGSVIDLGCGINGLTYKLLPKGFYYLGVEAVGQFVDLMNFYFEKNNFKAKAIHESLFNIEVIKGIIKTAKSPRIIFMFKVLDSLEMLERNYSKVFLKEIAPFSDFIVVSFATRSMIKRERFKVNRKWILDFIEENFLIVDSFDLGNEKYVLFKSKV